MRQNTAILSVIIISFFPIVAKCQQASTIPVQPDYRTAANSVPDCGMFPNRIAVKTTDAVRSQNLNAGGNAGRSGELDLRQEVQVTTGKPQELNACPTASREDGGELDSKSDCLYEQIVNFQMTHDGEPELEIPIWRLPGSTAFFYETGMTIDADGAPNAYHPDNIGLDDLANAGSPGNWQGLAKDGNGEPFVQGPDDPFPGYFVSATALADRTKPVNDPTRYVDASKIPFIVLPGALARQIGARPGDFAAVFNRRNGKSSYAIFGDVGPSDRIGEGSVALAENLGVRSDARNGGTRRGILFLVFPGSGNGRPRTIEDINTESEKLLQAWSGSVPLAACTAPAQKTENAGSSSNN